MTADPNCRLCGGKGYVVFDCYGARESTTKQCSCHWTEEDYQQAIRETQENDK